MIIQIRGTSGSGKSTVVRAVKDSLPGWESRHVAHRKKPLLYRRPGLTILGHYESPCGGCDTIGSARQVYELVDRLTKSNDFDYGTILCEGLLLSEDVKWSSQLPDLRVIYLTTTLETCLTRIESRRKQAGNTKPLNPSNTTNRVGIINRSRQKLIDCGVHCVRASCQQAVDLVMKWVRNNK